MKIWRFRRIGKQTWEIAFSQENMNAKLNGEVAEIIAPAKSILKRIIYKIKKHKCIELK